MDEPLRLEVTRVKKFWLARATDEPLRLEVATVKTIVLVGQAEGLATSA